MEELKISYDDYLSLVRRFAVYPARPAADSPDLSDEVLHGIWNEWADVVESIVVEMRWAIAHSVPLPRDEQVACVGKDADFSLDLSNQELTPVHMAAHLREMLRDGTVGRDELVGFMEGLRV